MPVAWDCDLLLKSVVPPFAEIKMSGDAADSTDTRHEPDQVEPGKEGLGWQGHNERGNKRKNNKKKGECGCWKFLPRAFSGLPLLLLQPGSGSGMCSGLGLRWYLDQPCKIPPV